MQREVLVRVKQRGFRVQVHVLVTTLSDHESDGAEDLTDLYYFAAAGRVEPVLVKIDDTNGSFELFDTGDGSQRNRQALVVRTDLLRCHMAESACHHNLRQTQRSFTDAMQTLREFSEHGLLEQTPAV